MLAITISIKLSITRLRPVSLFEVVFILLYLQPLSSIGFHALKSREDADTLDNL